ncbi:Uncharacterised protein [Mycobacteroides abscessus subsp. abscessus]|nr:Uncharacterised protein [Mycobacteroides abscessus subsp. abscessus]
MPAINRGTLRTHFHVNRVGSAAGIATGAPRSWIYSSQSIMFSRCSHASVKSLAQSVELRYCAKVIARKAVSAPTKIAPAAVP